MRIAAMLCVVAACHAARPSRPSTPAAYVPLAPTPIAIDGALRLIYELHVPQPELAEVQIFDETGTLLVELRGADLEHRVGRTPEPDAHAVVYLELAVARAPKTLVHRLAYGAGTGLARVDGPRVAVMTAPPLVLGPPVRGGPWAAVHDPAWARGHRRVFYMDGARARLPGRFAVDWIKLDADGRSGRGDPDEVTSWYGHGDEVLAVADGVVASTRDGVAETTTIRAHQQPPPEAAAGNYVALDVGGGRYVFYEHLRPGSIRVRSGDHVRRGQVIAALGFTGQSTGPHLHLHVADADATLGAEGLPWVLDRFEVLGRYDAIEALGKQPWTPGEARRVGERPAPNVVVQF